MPPSERRFDAIGTSGRIDTPEPLADGDFAAILSRMAKLAEGSGVAATLAG